MNPMMWSPDIWWTLFERFMAVSLMAIGGAVTLIPDLHRQLVLDQHLLSDNDFTSAFALAQAAPGPNLLFVALMGWYAAGLGGALASMLGMMVPSTTLTLAVSRWISTRRHWLSVRAFQAGLMPVTLGLLLATGAHLAPSFHQQPRALLLSGAIAILVWQTRIGLIWLVAAGGILGGLGLV
jgi:chromate transporter